MEKGFTIDTVADICRVNPSQIHQLIITGRLAFALCRTSGQKIIRHETLVAYLCANTLQRDYGDEDQTKKVS